MTAAATRRFADPKDDRPPEAKSPPFSADITPLRLKELRRLFRSWFGIQLADDDRCRKLLIIFLTHIATLRTNVEQQMDAAIDELAPWMSIDERHRFKELARSSQVTWTADELAAVLPLTFAERTALQIKTIGAVDLSKEDREKLRAQKHRDRQRERRRQERTQPKLPPSTWARTMAVLDLLPPKAEVPVKWLRQKLDGSKEFMGFALKPAVHRAIKQLEEKGLVRTRTPGGRMTAMWVGRRNDSSDRPVTKVEGTEGPSVPTNPSGYRAYLLAKLRTFTSETAKEVARWYYSEGERALRSACGIGPEPDDDQEFMALARARQRELSAQAPQER